MSSEIKKISNEIDDLCEKLVNVQFDIEVLEDISFEFIKEIVTLKEEKQLMITEHKKENQNES